MVVTTVDAPVLANTNEVESGCTINGIYIHAEAYATTAGALSNLYMMVFKNPGGNLTVPNANVVGASDNKKYSIHQEMIMMEKKINGNPRTLFNGVVVIPKGYRRFAINDTLIIQFFSPGVNYDVCVQSHYKEFR